MSRKYIVEQIVENFIFPNNDKPEYGMELVQDINNNSVSGTVVSFSATTISSSGITFSMDYTWLLNNAEPFIRNSNILSLCSVHMMLPESLNYKPWQVIQSQGTNTTGSAFFNGSTSFSVTPAQFGVSSFENGMYYFEVRFIGHRSIYPVCLSYDIVIPGLPTPTPTSTGSPTLEPTPTPTGGPTLEPTPTPTSMVSCTSYTVSTTSGSGQSYTYIECDGTPSGGNIGGVSGYDADTFCAQTGTVELIGVELTLTTNELCPIL
jgi:hypothetical protein